MFFPRSHARVRAKSISNYALVSGLFCACVSGFPHQAFAEKQDRTQQQAVEQEQHLTSDKANRSNDNILNELKSALKDNPQGGDELATLVTVTLAADPSLAPKIMRMAANLNQAQSQAIDTGLSNAILFLSASANSPHLKESRPTQVQEATKDNVSEHSNNRADVVSIQLTPPDKALWSGASVPQQSIENTEQPTNNATIESMKGSNIPIEWPLSVLSGGAPRSNEVSPN